MRDILAAIALVGIGYWAGGRRSPSSLGAMGDIWTVGPCKTKRGKRYCRVNRPDGRAHGWFLRDKAFETAASHNKMMPRPPGWSL